MSENEIAALRALLASRPRPASVAERRERLDALGDAYRTAEDIRVEPVSADGVPAEWSVAPGADASRVLLFLHGGGFSAGSIVSHRAMVAEAGRAAQGRTLAIDYRRTPEHPFPAALEDALRAYGWLLAQGVRPGRIAVGGDSAGGGLSLAVMVSLREHGLPLPARGWCISPWVDMEAHGESYAAKAAIDPIISKDYILELAGWYLGGKAPADPAGRAAPCRSAGSAAAAHSGRQRRDSVWRFRPRRRAGRCGGCSGYARGLAAHDSCVAAVPRATRRRAPRRCGPLSGDYPLSTCVRVIRCPCTRFAEVGVAALGDAFPLRKGARLRFPKAKLSDGEGDQNREGQRKRRKFIVVDVELYFAALKLE